MPLTDTAPKDTAPKDPDAAAPMLSSMRRWILPILLVVIAGFAAWQAVRSDTALAEAQAEVGGQSAPPLTTPLFSVRRTPEYLRGPVLLDNLSTSLDEVAAGFPTQSCLVVSIEGETVFESNPTLPLVPASTQKLLTAYGVYELVGGDRTYETQVVADAPVVDGVLDGNLYLIGGGDPTPATPNYNVRYEPPRITTDIEALADAVVAAGITEITGAVVGDETRYDDERYVPEWPERFTNVSQNQTGPLSALTINDGFVAFDPVTPVNALSTASTEPALFAAGFFDDLLEARGLIISQSPFVEPAPIGARTIASVTSDPIGLITNEMVDVSDNMTAELLLKEVGLEASGRGTTDDGALAIENALRADGFSVAETDIVDGSGLASQNRLTCRLLVEVLDATAGTPLHDGLAVAGQTGTLADRLVGTDAVGRVRAKTGRLNEVGALAGTAEANDGTVLTFAWIGNTTGQYAIEDIQAAQDDVVMELIEFPQGPEIDALAPAG